LTLGEFRWRGRLLRLNPTFLDHLLNEFVDQFVQFFGVAFSAVFKPLFQKFVWNPSHFDEFFDDRLAQGLEIVRTTYIMESVLETALKEELRHLVEEFFEA
jgi:hypothetical protein